MTGNIVGGHQRYKVLKAEGATEVDCVVVHIENPQDEKALNILRAPVPAATTPRVHFSTPGDASGTEIYRIHTDFSEAETRKGTLNLRSGPGRNFSSAGCV